MSVRARARRIGVSLALILLASGCGDTPATAPAERAVSLETTACGHASMTSGAGIIVDDGWVLASAHVVSGAGDVTVSGGCGSGAADVVVFSAASDLALLRVPAVEAEPVQIATAQAGQQVVLAGAGPSTTPTTASILRPVDVRIEAVRSTDRVSRLGYEIDTRVALGDSGGGVFDVDGNLVGVIFGRTQATADRSFVVRHEEIRALLGQDRVGSWSCDPDQSQIVETMGVQTPSG